MELLLPHRLPTKPADLIRATARRVPFATAARITIAVQPELSAYRGELFSGRNQLGTPVHAASFIRQRRIVLEEQLMYAPASLSLILTHELFHFVWPRLGNRIRSEFHELIQGELARHARGELGESAAVSKAAWLARKGDSVSGRLWRHYLCEAFCDTAAFLYAGVNVSEHFTLSERRIARRSSWFGMAIDWKSKCF